jgi:predicted ATP-dependent serine protease
MAKVDIPRITTGVPNLDAIFNGGLPEGSVTVASGPPGDGQGTVLTDGGAWLRGAARTAHVTGRGAPPAHPPGRTSTDQTPGSARSRRSLRTN